MTKATIAIKLENDVVNKFKAFCRDRGIKFSFFVEEAIRQKMDQEELKEDLLDLKTLHSQEASAVSFEEYLRKRSV